VVFIPAVEQGTYPSYRCVEAHEVAEERRLLYVAMTRAQVFLVCPLSPPYLYERREVVRVEREEELMKRVSRTVI
jgi:superfamily I DNA/RNA helicase